MGAERGELVIEDLALPLALRFISGKYQGGEFPLPDSGEIVIGRSSELDMVLVEDMVSRRHAKISVEGGDKPNDSQPLDCEPEHPSLLPNHPDHNDCRTKSTLKITQSKNVLTDDCILAFESHVKVKHDGTVPPTSSPTQSPTTSSSPSKYFSAVQTPLLDAID